MKDWLLGKLFGFVGGKLSGYKTYAAGVGFILTGIVGFLSQMFPDQHLPPMTFEQSMASIMAGVACLGGRHAITKMQNATVQAIQASTTQATAPPIPEPTGQDQCSTEVEQPGPAPGSGAFGPNAN